MEEVVGQEEAVAKELPLYFEEIIRWLEELPIDHRLLVQLGLLVIVWRIQLPSATESNPVLLSG